MSLNNEAITREQSVCIVIGSAFIAGIGEGSSLFELASLPLLFRELHDDCLENIFFLNIKKPAVGTCVLGFGNNQEGQLGLGDIENRNQPAINLFLDGLKIIQIACGNRHTIVLLECGDALSFGLNRFGQLGHGDHKDKSVPTAIPALKGKLVVEVACGSHHSIALLGNGDVYSWGHNDNGQLGIGTNFHQDTPTQIMSFTGKYVSKIVSSYWHCFAILETDEIFGWGSNEEGQLGICDLDDRNFPTQITSLKGKRIISICCGFDHSIALCSFGNVYFAGDTSMSFQNQIPQNSFQMIPELKDIIQISSGMKHCFALQENGDLFAFGDNVYGQLGLGDWGVRRKAEKYENRFWDGSFITQICCSDYSSVFLLNSDKVFACGNRKRFCLIEQTQENRDLMEPTFIDFSPNKQILSYICEGKTTFILCK